MFPPPPAPAPVVAAAPSAADGPTEAVEDVPSALQPATTTVTAVDGESPHSHSASPPDGRQYIAWCKFATTKNATACALLQKG